MLQTWTQVTTGMNLEVVQNFTQNTTDLKWYKSDIHHLGPTSHLRMDVYTKQNHCFCPTYHVKYPHAAVTKHMFQSKIHIIYEHSLRNKPESLVP